MRRLSSILLSVGAVSLLGLVGAPVVDALPTLAFTPEFSSGALGGPGSVNASLKIEGTEYGGFPPPTVQVALKLPAGTTVRAGDHATCTKAVLEQTGPKGCLRTSIAGPVGQALAIVSFGSERVEESATVESFFAPEGGLSFFLDGHTPTSLEILASATVSGSVINIEVPLVSTVPGAPFASLIKLGFRLGETEAEEVSSNLTSGVTLPGLCPTGKFSWASAVTFDENGADPIRAEDTAQAAETGCLERQEPVRNKRAEEVVAKKRAEEEASAKRKAEEAELVALKELVRQLDEEFHAAVDLEGVKISERGVLLTVKTSEPGVLRVTGLGLKKIIMTLSPGTHRLSMTLTKEGKGERKAHKTIKLSVSLRVGSRTVSASRQVRL